MVLGKNDTTAAEIALLPSRNWPCLNGVITLMAKVLMHCSKKAQKALSPVVHDIGGLICRIDGVLIADFHSPGTLLGHICTTYQLGPKTPSLTASQFHIHGHIVIGILQDQALKSQGAPLMAAQGLSASCVSQLKVPMPASDYLRETCG